MKEKLKDFCNSINIEYIGIVDEGPYYDLESILIKRDKLGYITGFEEKDIEKRIKPKATMENCKSIIVCLFPYYTGKYKKGNLSKYTRGIDYHIVVKKKLELIAEYLRKEINHIELIPFVDSGPLVERYIAQKAGLGFWGINGNLINEKYGSYFFIGYIMTNYHFEPDKPNKKECLKCMKCVENCPGKVVFGDFELNPSLCKSYLTQKKGDLTEEEINIINKDQVIFGCDVCQDVCPHNKNVEITPIDEFYNNSIINILNHKEIHNISNKEFKRLYGDRAFSWRGIKVIKRNLECVRKK